ncbi:MAG TPA: multicopper oxidase family protein [Terracidiphilus sp.]|jgi:spore coat protein A
MNSTNRRAFLKLCAQSLPALALAKGIDANGIENSASAQPAYRTPASLEPYIDALPILKRLTPYETHKDKVVYRIRMLECKQQMHSQLPPTRLWGYEAQYPGPIIEAYRGKLIEVRWENHLPSQHLFEVDPHIHGAMPPAPAVRTVPHLHGSRSRSESDGLPEKWFVPGDAALYSYPNDQPAATLWYHDHALGITRLNVYAGLSGFFLLRDDEERSMALPSGAYEIPLILQDRTLDDAGQLVYSPTNEDGVKLPPGVWGPEFFGDLPVVNGAISPYLAVEPRPYRLRVLNSSNSRFLNLFLNLAKHPTDIPSLVPFHQIGTDGGFLPKPVPLTKLLLGPAERADLIVDFTGLEGKTITLSNNGAAPFPGWDAMLMNHAPLYEWMQFRVTLPIAGDAKSIAMAHSISSSPTFFSKLDEAASVTTRDFVLTERLDAKGRSLGVRINDKGYDDPVTEIVKLNSVEKWRFINTTDDAHPMHLHLVQFQILQRQGFDPAALFNGTLRLVGTPRPPAANEAGWKDTAVVNPRDVLTILVRFEGYTGRYVFHCHMLEHEDNDMMRPYEVIP